MIAKNRIHESRHAPVLLKKCHRLRKSECHVLDRGYDPEKMHRLIRETLNADSVIPVRMWSNTENIWGKYRKEMNLSG